MDQIVSITVELVRKTQRALTRKWSFLGIFAFTLFVNVGFLGSLDLLPNASALSPAKVLTAVSGDLTDSSLSTLAAAIPAVKIESPERIEIPVLGMNVTVENTESTNIKTLDALLLNGAVRYPTSARLGEDGNVVLFGHSSYLPVVGNQAYRAFNDIQKLTKGDVVTVSSAGTAYTYRVRSVVKASANDASIPLLVEGRVLTLVTCESFGKKSDRFILTADFVESHSLGA